MKYDFFENDEILKQYFNIEITIDSFTGQIINKNYSLKDNLTVKQLIECIYYIISNFCKHILQNYSSRITN
ncbi:hypothetical protein [Metamycoplasma equirhinis]|uniref:hypothetical protein n=1 Tax=Metamycoplasma equirhinis TaxID=92402 RepID=UPI003593FB8C